jgi:hypothetical protein
MPKRLKPIPKFRSEADERRFWETHDTTEYLDWSRAELARLPSLQPAANSSSSRLPDRRLNSRVVCPHCNLPSANDKICTNLACAKRISSPVRRFAPARPVSKETEAGRLRRSKRFGGS